MKKISLLHVLTIVFFIISCSVILFNYLIPEVIFSLEMLQLFCIIVSFLCLFISLLEFYCGLFNIRFDSDSMKFYKGKRNYMKINYCDIKYLSLLVAVDYYWSPILDSDKKKCIVISAYSSESDAIMNVSPDGIMRMPRSNYAKSNSDSDNVFRSLYNKDKEGFAEMLKHTKAKIYISEELFDLYTEEFNEIFKNTDNLVFVSCFGKSGEKFLKPINYQNQSGDGSVIDN